MSTLRKTTWALLFGALAGGCGMGGNTQTPPPQQLETITQKMMCNTCDPGPDPDPDPLPDPTPVPQTDAGTSTYDAGTPPPPPPPETTFRIDAPNVNQAVTEYRTITFAPGDEVYVTAGGCAQTGGSGSTWKRYVNPSGDNADRLYHGRIWIPGATMGLETVASLINRSPVVVPSPPPGANPGEMFLRLGYDDDDYSNNGYWGHDDGTENQCLNVGNAWVQLRVVHRGGAGTLRPCPTLLQGPMLLDPYWTALDPNFLPLNPRWGMQCGPYSNGVDFAGACGVDYMNDVHQPKLGNCTSVVPTADTKDALFGLCSSGYDVNGHLNWGLATYTGRIYWEELDSEITGDGDYNLVLKTDGDPGITVHNDVVPRQPDPSMRGMALEFSSAETLNALVNSNTYRPVTPLWASMRNGSDTDRANLLDGRPAIAVGLVGFDVVHDIKTEIHPVLGLAIQVKSPARGDSEEAWMIMARHQGNEGECSHDDAAPTHGFAGGDMRFLLPTSYGDAQVSTTTTSFLYRSNAAATYSVSSQAAGQLLLTLPNPAPGEVILGEVHFHPNAPAPITSRSYPSKCADAAYNTSADGTRVWIWDCWGGPNQQWKWNPANGEIRGIDGKCLDAAGYGTANGTVVQIWSCTGATNQKWFYDYFSGRIIGQASGRCLDLTAYSVTNGNGLQLYDCTGNWNQSWTLGQ